MYIFIHVGIYMFIYVHEYVHDRIIETRKTWNFQSSEKKGTKAAPWSGQ